MLNADSMFQVGQLHGIDLNVSTPEQALRELERLIQLRNSHFVCFFEGNLFYRSLREKTVKDTINQATLVYPDGIAVAKALSWQLRRPVQRVSGPAFLLQAGAYGISRNWRHFFLGGGEGVAERLAEKLCKQYPSLQVAGTFCPPFRPMTENEELEIKQKIEESHTDLLWVGLGGPKQEFWMNAHLGKIAVPVMLGVGAAFDFHSGNRPWAPLWIRKIGMEWLFRALSGGKNTLQRNVKCVSRVAVVLTADMVRYIFSPSRKVSLQTKYPDDPCRKCDGVPCSLSMPYCPKILPASGDSSVSGNKQGKSSKNNDLFGKIE